VTLSNHKYVLPFIAAIAIVGVAAWFAVTRVLPPNFFSSAQSHTVYGQITLLAKNQITVTGVHVLDGKGGESNFGRKETIAVDWDETTRFTKEIWHLPAHNASGKLVKPLVAAEIRKEDVLGRVFDLRSGTPITVTTSESTLHDGEVKAKEIRYIVSVYGDNASKSEQ